MVIRHVMDFTHALGERYLWVDRLCITQDDVGDVGTLSQVAKMDKIYGGAYLTIIAASSDEMYNQGLAADWSTTLGVLPRLPLRIYIPGYRHDGIGVNTELVDLDFDDPRVSESNRQTYGREMDSCISDLYDILSKSRRATRGWTYQEQIVSRRCVMFLDEGIFWDCHCCVWDGPDILPRTAFANSWSRSDMGQRLTTRWWPDFSFYIDLICLYNGREFSYPQDVLLGLTGS